MMNVRAAMFPFLPLLAAAILSQESEGPKPKPQVRERESATGRDATLTGDVVALACRLGGAVKAVEPHECASACLSKGSAGLEIPSTGELYLAFEPDRRPAVDRLRQLAGQRVQVSGKVVDGLGVKIFFVEKVTEVEEEGSPSPASASISRPKEATVRGPIVNVLCAVESAAKGEEHACGDRCFEGNALLGVLDERGRRAYVAFSIADENGDRKPAHAILRPLAGATVEVTGRISGPVIEVVKAVKA